MTQWQGHHPRRSKRHRQSGRHSSNVLPPRRGPNVIKHLLRRQVSRKSTCLTAPYFLILFWLQPPATHAVADLITSIDATAITSNPLLMTGFPTLLKSPKSPMLLVIPPLDFDAILSSITDGYIDPLTECFNARAFSDLRSEAPKRRLLYYFDLDDLKVINDRDGHAAGDEYIRDNAARLRATFRRYTDVIYRIGGDEFVVISDFPADLVGLESFSIGVALIQDDLEAAIVQADQLMYQNKRERKLCKQQRNAA